MRTHTARYSRLPTPGDPRNTEAWALTEAARRMNEARDKGAEELLKAVRLNWRLWTIFQTSLLDPETHVPHEIRENMLNLSNFVDKRTVELISDPKGELADVLVNINLQIAGGLRDSGNGEKISAGEPVTGTEALDGTTHRRQFNEIA